MQEEARKKNKKQILVVLVLGAVLLIADLAAQMTVDTVPMVRSDGTLYMIRPEEGKAPGHLRLRAIVQQDGKTFDEEFNVSLAPYSEETPEQKEPESATLSVKEKTEYELRSAAGGFNGDLSMKRVPLPEELESGATVSWHRERDSNAVMIGILTMISAFALYRNRFAAFRREKEKQRDSVLRQLPEFVNRMVLLLNAGLVPTTAFERSVTESLELREEDDYFYGKLRGICETVRTTNGSMHLEFREFAKESGVKELMRISNILNDNIKKGVSLCEKLEAESEFLWLTRKKNCEERTRLVDTKMTLPLLLFLIGLVVITVAPAMLEL